MFTLEIGGRAIAVMNADEQEAREFFEGEAFLDDLRTMESDGTPIWDGKGPLTVRKASDDEVQAFEETVGGDEEDDDEDEEGLDVLFLVDIDDFGDDEDEEAGHA